MFPLFFHLYLYLYIIVCISPTKFVQSCVPDAQTCGEMRIVWPAAYEGRTWKTEATLWQGFSVQKLQSFLVKKSTMSKPFFVQRRPCVRASVCKRVCAKGLLSKTSLRKSFCVQKPLCEKTSLCKDFSV